MEHAPAEKEERKEGPFTKEDVIEAFESGDMAEGWRRFDDWYQMRQHQTEFENRSADRIALAIETVEVNRAAGEKDGALLQVREIEEALNSDTSLTENERGTLSMRWASLAKQFEE